MPQCAGGKFLFLIWAEEDNWTTPLAPENAQSLMRHGLQGAPGEAEERGRKEKGMDGRGGQTEARGDPDGGSRDTRLTLGCEER